MTCSVLGKRVITFSTGTQIIFMVGPWFAGGLTCVSNPDKLKGKISDLVKDPEKGYLLDVDVSPRPSRPAQ